MAATEYEKLCIIIIKDNQWANVVLNEGLKI